MAHLDDSLINNLLRRDLKSRSLAEYDLAPTVVPVYITGGGPTAAYEQVESKGKDATHDLSATTGTTLQQLFTVPEDEVWLVLVVSLANNTSTNTRAIYLLPRIREASVGVKAENVAAGTRTVWEPSQPLVLRGGDSILCEYAKNGGAADAVVSRILIGRRVVA